ncbi:hypothetical protein AURDEDRAFT_64960 [Auricularia subglabra TFB-10046 SS5]|nr:hypothetical protein AURDEDRAFT_64960 [Auricularia subglabra TFB-10046 SS5]
MVLSFPLALPALFSVVNAAVVQMKPAMRVHEYRASAPDGFVAVSKAPADAPLTLRLGLKQRDSAGLAKALYRVSDPSSPDYGKHLSQEEVAAFLGPTPETLAAVNTWLAANGIVAVPFSPAGDWLEFNISAAAAGSLFDTEFTVFEHAAEGGSRGIRTLQYSLPDTIQPHIDLFLPGISFWNPTHERKAPMFTEVKALDDPEKRQDPSGIQFITPEILQSFYNIPSAPAPASSNSLAVSGFNNQWANRDDLTLFGANYRPDIPSATFVTHRIDGGINNQSRQDAGDEASLDIQYTVGIATGVPVTFITVGSNYEDGFYGFLDIIKYLGSQVPNQPKVLSTSYSFDEASPSAAAMERLCNAYASLGAQGTSIIFSTGDHGVAGKNRRDCSDSDSPFLPTFPGGCPFVTAVGATRLGKTEVAREDAADLSAGGFSNVFPIPDYQASAVAAYQEQIGDLYEGRYNPSGRGFPDVSALGENYAVALRGSIVPISGTSASTPVFASIVSLINSRRMARGGSPLGFLNPFLYANPGIFNDIETGSNPGCGTDGFPAKAGWDPVSIHPVFHPPQAAPNRPS